VPWRYEATASTAITNLKNKISNLKVIAVEQDAKAVSISNFKFQISNLLPVAIVVGHETEGVSKEVLDMADYIVEIPMFGVNKSLNVVVSTGIVLHRLLK
jgi:TrmH family RNA methyltransferase